MALAKATIVRDEMEKKIASRGQLFEETAEPLVLMEAVSRPGAVKGHFDHFGLDLKHGRLFATPEDYHAVLVLDLISGKPLATISGISRPHAVVYREDLDRLFVTDGEDGALKMFQGSSYQPAGRIALAKDADSIGYDPARQRSIPPRERRWPRSAFRGTLWRPCRLIYSVRAYTSITARGMRWP